MSQSTCSRGNSAELVWCLGYSGVSPKTVSVGARRRPGGGEETGGEPLPEWSAGSV